MKDKLILYEDRDIIVCHKMAGIPVQSARIGQKDMVSILNNYLAEKRREAKADTGRKGGKECLERSGSKDMAECTEKSGRKDALEPVKVVHRLDQPVEGVIVFAKTKRAAAGLGRQIAEGSMKKIYHAVCCVTERASNQEWYEGIEDLMSDEMSDKIPDLMPDKIPGERKQSREFFGRTYQLMDYLVRDGRTNTSRVTDKGKKDAKRAELSYRILNAAEIHKKKYLLAEIELKTGRHHQIRVQMAHAGIPLYGDTKYNDKWEEYRLNFDAPDAEMVSGRLGQSASGRSVFDAPGEETESCGPGYQVSGGSGRKNPGLALCAVSLTFRHPVSGKQMTFETRPESEIFTVF